MSDATGNAITEGGLVRPLVRLAWPIVVLQLLQVAYNVTDTLWLGRYDVTALGALSLAFPLVFLLIAVAAGFNTAGSILVAQYTGAENRARAGLVAGQTITFVTLLSTVLGVLGVVFARDLLALLPSRPETAATVVPAAARYMEVLFVGIPFVFGFFVFAALLRGAGDTRTPMYVMLVSVVLNVVLDPLLIFGYGPVPELGIVGAAVATVVARGLAAVVGVWLLFARSVGPDVELGDLRPDLEVIRSIVDIGVPSAIEQSASALALVALTAVVVGFAPPVVAAYGLGNRLVSLVFLPALGLGRATDTMVGQNLGAGRADRATRAVRLAGFAAAGVLLVVGVLAALVPEPVVSVFVARGDPEAAETVRLGSDYLRIRSVEFVFIGVMQVLLGAYRGAGDTRTAMAFSLLTMWVVRVPAVVGLAVVADWGATGVWVGMTLGHVVGAPAAALWFRRGTWREAVIDRPRPPVDTAPEPDPLGTKD